LWYERLFGGPPSFVATPTEAVWELAAHRSVYIVERPEHAGHAMHTIFVDDPDALVGRDRRAGIEPTARETYDFDVRKVTYHDLDGNEFGFGGAPV